MPLQGTSGAASQDGFGGNGVAVVPAYIEDVFSCFLYTGNGATQTITNGIDLSTNGGLVWVKTRTTNTGGGTYNNSNILADSARTPSNILRTNGTEAQDGSPSFSSFNSNGFTLGTSANTNNTGVNSVSWTFRKQPKFFDVVTYTGNGTAGRTVSHNLGSVPGCIIVKSTSASGFWRVYHRSIGNTGGLSLSQTTSTATTASYWNNTSPTSTQFTLGDATAVNGNGDSFVAYLFAHDAGGFGLTGTDNVISCGSYTGNGSTSGNPVTLGFEPQWVMIKQTSASGNNWVLVDTMRGIPTGGDDALLYPNTSGAEAYNDRLSVTSTGFSLNSLGGDTNANGSTYIYIAIRRGPMKVPTTGTSVFSPNSQTASTGTAITTNFPPDLQLYRSTAQVANEGVAVDRLRGVNSTTTANSTPWLDTTTAAAEATASSVTRNWGNTGFEMPGFVATIPSVFYSFRRAPSFMDVVCYTGTGSATTFSHNLQAVPELMIVKRRSAAADWSVYSSALGNNKYLSLNDTIASSTTATYWNNTTPTSSVFTVGVGAQTNGSGSTYVAYLFATCAGVSKVGSYTGTATTKQIDCGFTAGARFVLIKRTDSTGDWYVWDSARGIVAGNDSYLLLNSTAAEVTSTDYIDTYSAGFEISSTAPAAINANGGSFIFFAVA